VFTVDIDSASSFYCKKTGGYNTYMNSGRFCLPRSGFVQQRLSAGLASLAAEAGREAHCENQR